MLGWPATVCSDHSGPQRAQLLQASCGGPALAATATFSLYAEARQPPVTPAGEAAGTSAAVYEPAQPNGDLAGSPQAEASQSHAAAKRQDPQACSAQPVPAAPPPQQNAEPAEQMADGAHQSPQPAPASGAPQQAADAAAWEADELLRQLARVFQGHQAALVAGAGVAAALLHIDPSLSEEQVQFLRMTVGGWKGLLKALAQEACTRYAIPGRRLEVQVRLALEGYFPPDVRLDQLDALLPEAAWAGDYEALCARVAAAFGGAATGPAGEEPLYAAAAIIEQVVAASDRIAGLQNIKTAVRRLVELICQALQANPHNPLVGPLKALATGYAPLLTTNYDTFLERCCNRNALYYEDILPCRACTRLAERPTLVQAVVDQFLVASAVGASYAYDHYVVHLHGLYYDKGIAVLTRAEYEATERTFLEFMLPLARQRSLVFVGSEGFLDFHFLRLWEGLMLEGSPRRHYVLVLAASVDRLRRRILDAATGRLRLWMDNIVLVPYGDDYAELPVFLSRIMRRMTYASRPGSHATGGGGGGGGGGHGVKRLRTI